MKNFFSFALVIIGIYACLNLSSCKKDDDVSDNSIVGTWVQDGDDDIFVFSKDGKYVTYENLTDYENDEKAYFGSWSVNGAVFIIVEEGYYDEGFHYYDNPYKEVYSISNQTKNSFTLKDSDGDTWTFTRFK